ncbi:60S ribosomal protein L35 [Cladophialophora carrionii CBS 160.54]|uniref:60S ribosomal protein L35 n=1 Tax=Cladophialophora carrionii CBS 160.54 TaxID=1279043 RepID=V9D8N7_9EURO|nr:60S ribosomal protein L35 [Cladophialophora carrionii CBS 160.54]ETI22337.1 60S ribosomal protein L35 [Cladophialophora carrionii CBS 160.54]
MPRRSGPQPITHALISHTVFDIDNITQQRRCARVKPGQLWGKSKDDLKKQLDELKTELGQLRVQKIAGGASSKLTRIHDLRKSVARTLTVINANQRHQLRLFYAKKKYLPLDLRPKLTRAIRRRLSKKDAARVTEKQKKKQTHFPARKYAVKAE